jgi:hypothetical protein
VLAPTDDGATSRCFISTSFDETSHFESTIHDVQHVYRRLTGEVRPRGLGFRWSERRHLTGHKRMGLSSADSSGSNRAAALALLSMTLTARGLGRVHRTWTCQSRRSSGASSWLQCK